MATLGKALAREKAEAEAEALREARQDKAKADDEAAAQLLGVATGHLSAFYKNENIDQGEIQGSTSAGL